MHSYIQYYPVHCLQIKPIRTPLWMTPQRGSPMGRLPTAYSSISAFKWLKWTPVFPSWMKREGKCGTAQSLFVKIDRLTVWTLSQFYSFTLNFPSVFYACAHTSSQFSPIFPFSYIISITSHPQELKSWLTSVQKHPLKPQSDLQKQKNPQKIQCEE